MKYSMNALTVVLLSAVVLFTGCGSGGDSENRSTPSDPVERVDNANLAELHLSDSSLFPAFQSDQTSYTATVGHTTLLITVTAIAEAANAEVSINGESVVVDNHSALVELIEGPNLITVVVTAEDQLSTNSYLLEVTREPASSFEQVYMKATDAESEDLFGTSLALTPGILAIGAPGKAVYGVKDIGGDILPPDYCGTEPMWQSNAGAVYIFGRNNQYWTEQDLVRSSNVEGSVDCYFMGSGPLGSEDKFGFSVAVEGGILVVGAPGEASGSTIDQIDNSATDAGAVYMFAENSGAWEQRYYMKAPQPQAGGKFGHAVALTANTLVVGSPNENSADEGAGFIYIYTLQNDSWVLESRIGTGRDDEFGYSLAFDGNTLIVGAPGDDGSPPYDPYTANSGAVYVFQRSNGEWVREAYLKALNAGPNLLPYNGDRFGTSVALYGNLMLVGAPYESSSVGGGEADDSSFRAGAAYIFMRSAESWEQTAFLKASNARAAHEFGTAVGIFGSTAVVGAPLQPQGPSPFDPNAPEVDLNIRQSGAAYLFASSNGIWREEVFLKANTVDSGDKFGTSVVLSPDSLVIGAPGEDASAYGGEADNSTPDAGALYVFP